MRWLYYIFIAVILQIAATEEKIEVIAAVPEEVLNEGNEISNSDQVALESTAKEGSSSSHQYSGPPGRGHGTNRNSLGQSSSNYHGPPPPPVEAADKSFSEHPSNDVYELSAGDQLHHPDNLLGVGGVGGEWPASAGKTPKIVSLDVKCERNSMKVFIAFDKPFYGIIFSKGHYSNPSCVHLKPGQGASNANFEIGIHACGTAGNTENGYYGYGSESGSGTYFENVIVIQYDPQVQEIWDQARKLRCTWHDQYEKRVTFRPFPVDMLEIIRADFAGDNVGCWMQIQVGRGPWASEVSGLVKIGQAMTMVLAIKDYDSKFDMLVRNCMAHDGKHAPIQLVDRYGCVTRPKLMSRFTKIKNFGASASILSYAHFQAFKFPDSMEVHFQCTIQICRHRCPEQCDKQAGPYSELYGPAGSRERRAADPKQEVGLNKVIRVVSTGDLTFPVDEPANASVASTLVFPARADGVMCMATISFMIALVVLLFCLVMSCLFSAFLWIKLRSFSRADRKLVKLNKQHAKKSQGGSLYS